MIIVYPLPVPSAYTSSVQNLIICQSKEKGEKERIVKPYSSDVCIQQVLSLSREIIQTGYAWLIPSSS